MRVKWGVRAAAVVGVLMLGASVHAQGSTSTPESTVSPDTTSVPESTAAPESTVAPDTTSVPESATTTTVPAEPLTASPGPVGPARAGGQTPVRGTQFQISPPPPTLAADDPFRVPENSGTGRRIVYSKSQQTVWVFDDTGTLIKSHRVSGKQTPYDPAPGVYRVWSRSIRTNSINNPSITWGYMVRFAKGARGGNIGFHEIPYQYGRPVQTPAELGQALSGGCVRQTTADAIWMWNWADIGTVVVVTP